MPGLKSRTLGVVAVLALGGLGLSGCATRGYVDERVTALNARIDAVDTKATDAIARADAAAQAAQAAGTDAQAANQRLDQLTGRVERLEQMPVRRTPRN